MHFLPYSRLRRTLRLSASSLALLAASSAIASAQGNNESPTPGASAPAASPEPTPSPSVQAPQPPATEPQSEAPAQQATGPNVLPEVRVVAPKQQPRPRQRPPQVATNQLPAPPTQQQVVATQNERFDAARKNIFPPVGANSYEVTHQALEALPQGNNSTLDKALLQFPGVTQDSAAAGELHVRNEHANLQYRINGIMLPDGVGGFGQILDTGIVGNMALLTGALPAQYGLRTAGVLDIQTKSDAFNNTGTVSVYGGSHQTITPFAEYGGTIGPTQYYVSGRFLYNDLGIENPTAAREAIHDRTQQEKGFLYLSTVLDRESRLTWISGVSNSLYQIPNNPGQPSAFVTATQTDFNSAFLNERQQEINHFNVVAYQHSAEGIDTQLSYFNRYSQLHFWPDPVGDLLINGISSSVYRQSYVNGVQEDTAWRVADAHTLRFGFTASAEQSLVTSINTTFPGDPVNGQAFDPASGTPLDPVTIHDSNSKLGWLFGAYVQDEWKITDHLTLNAGLRFDQMWQYVDANQFSPRVSLTWVPQDGTTVHAGYARTFTPPQQVIAAPTNIALFQGTVAAPAMTQNDPVLPERADIFDAGVVQKVWPIPGLEIGLDGYVKLARDLLDDGQFGAAYVLSGFNYEKANNVGLEFKASYTNGPLKLYGNVAWARQIGTNIVSNQYLFDPDEFAYIASHYIPTDHSQVLTASAGGSYKWHDTTFTASMIYGSGLRSGFANTDHLPSYTQVNVGVSHDFYIYAPSKPTTLRFDVVNVFDKVYEIRDGSGIGVFAPQFGPRRGFFFGISQKI
jgi:outer membrane receptor protein involved in Fe transport